MNNYIKKTLNVNSVEHKPQNSVSNVTQTYVTNVFNKYTL